jgi:hypothetical protein
MAQTAETLLAEIAALPANERAKLIGSLNQRQSNKPEVFDQTSEKWFDSPDPEPSMRWIEEHRVEYANQYVALMGDKLIAHSTNAREVIAVVHAGNFNGAFFGLVSPPDEPMFAGF